MAGDALRREIGEIPASLEQVLAHGPAEVAALLQSVQLGSTDTVWVTGNGTSLHAALGVAAFYRSFRPASAPHLEAIPAHEFLRHPPRLGKGDLVLGISASGESGDVLAVERAVRGTVPFVGLTNEGGSSLARLAGDSLAIHAGAATVPSTTKTYVNSLAMLYLFALALMEQHQAVLPWVRSGLAGLPAAARTVLEQTESAAAAFGERLAAGKRKCDAGGRTALPGYCLVYGTGPLYPLAKELALKLKETALIPAEAVETGELLHGTVAVVNRVTTVVGLHLPDQDPVILGKVASSVAAFEGALFTIGGPETDLPLPEGLHPWLAPFLWCIPGYLTARSAALALGLDPDSPEWYQLYLAATR